MSVANVCYHIHEHPGSKWENMVAFATIATTNFEPCSVLWILTLNTNTNKFILGTNRVKQVVNMNTIIIKLIKNPVKKC